MDFLNNDVSNIKRYAKQLYRISGRFNLYINICHKEFAPNKERLRFETEKIKQIISQIENEIDSLNVQ